MSGKGFLGKMECEAIHAWTFSGLVGAFLDLAIAFLLLCGSATAFIAAKLLGVFGLCLPCPCDGLFWNFNRNTCLQRRLVDCPSEKVSAVQLSVKSKFPFDTILSNNPNCELNLVFVREKNNADGSVEFKGEVLCRSFSDVKELPNLDGKDSARKNELDVGATVMNLPASKENCFDVKGKSILTQKRRSGIWHRKGAVDDGKLLLVMSCEPQQSDIQANLLSPYSGCVTGSEDNEEGLGPVNYGDESLHDDWDVPTVANFGERTSHCFELNEPSNENELTEKNALSLLGFKHTEFGELGFDGNQNSAILVLEQVIREECAARAALCLELEKERAAAASAADEAMAMILRLQEEKALTELDARQYQRMIEEKCAYDAEEMNILKEILLRRERENLFLQKEIESYRHMMLSQNEPLEEVHGVMDIQGLASSLNSSEDPVLTLHWLSESFGHKKNMRSAIKCTDYETVSLERQNCVLSFGKELPIPKRDEDTELSKPEGQPNIDELHHLNDQSNQEFQEKGVVSVDEKASVQAWEEPRIRSCPQFPQGHDLLHKTINLSGEEQNVGEKLCQRIAPTAVQINSKAEICIPYDGEDVEKHTEGMDEGSKGPYNSIYGTESSVLDVHVVDDGPNQCNVVNGNKCGWFSEDATSEVPREHNVHFEASKLWSGTEPDVNRSTLDVSSGFPPWSNKRSKTLTCDRQRNSTSTLDNEKLKIVSEVGWLRERLKVVQEGRNKLRVSMEQKEREKICSQKQDMASQVHESWQQSEPGKAVRQVSLPPPSSKFISKKRRCRSVSLGVHESI